MRAHVRRTVGIDLTCIRRVPPELSLPQPHPTRAATATAGLLFGLLAYGWWGSAVPMYLWWYKGVVPAHELLCWRVLFGVPVLLLLLPLRGQWRDFTGIFGDGRTFRLQSIAALLLASNWMCYILAVVTGRAVEAALGYYMNPLVNVALGAIVLGERHGRLQWIAIGLAAAGVAVETINYGRLPWIALVLAFSFGFYGLVRKQAKAGPLPGLAAENVIMLPFALAGIAIISQVGDGLHWPEGDAVRGAGLFASGLMTIVPLLAFAAAARRLRLATVGMLQYLAPSGQLLLAVFVFDEPFDEGRFVAFTLIWIAVILYCVAAYRARPRRA